METIFNPTDRLSVTLEAQQWNQVLALLAEGPYRVVAPIFTEMQRQLQEPARPYLVEPEEAAQ